MKTLFKIKDKNLYLACKIYYEECEHCGDNYITETVRNTVTRWSEHNNLDHKSEPTNTLKEILIMYSIGSFMPSSFTETSQQELRNNFYCII